MNLLLTSLLFPLLIYSGDALAISSKLLSQGQKMVKLLDEARRCSVHYKNDTLSFCTGMELRKEDLKFLKDLDLKSCKNFLKKMDYKVIEAKLGDQIKNVPKADLDDFFGSTKLALILHLERTILFKREAKRGDCLHEVLHFYQRHRKTKNALSPINRKMKEKELQFLLEGELTRVTDLEKKGKKREAQLLADNMQPFIALQKEWQRMLHWLDEKEVYQVFFDYGELLGTKERDYDVALANLVRLKDSLPWDLNERVLFYANRELNKKYAAVKIPKSDKGLDEASLGKLYNQGKISRDSFESKVIGLRKFKANQEVKKYIKEDNLYGRLISEVKLRAFEKEKDFSEIILKEINFDTEKDLWVVKMNKNKMIVDTGAQMSVFPLRILVGLKRKDVRLLGSKSIQTSYGRALQAPIVQILRPISFNGQKIVGLRGALGSLGLPGFDGIIGLDFLNRYNRKKWVLDMKKKQLRHGVVTGGQSYYLEKNGLGNIDALEFKCSSKKNHKIRLDSGSQFLGEKIKGDLFCLKQDVVAQMKIEAPNPVLFSREVVANLGTPFFRRYTLIGINLIDGQLSLVEAK